MWMPYTTPTPPAQPLPPPFTSRLTNSAMQTAATAAERPPDRYVARLAGEVDENELLDEIGLAGVTWLRETGLATCPSPPPLASAHVAASPILAAAAGERSILHHRVLRLAGEVDED